MSNPNVIWATATENLPSEVRSEIARIAASRKWLERNRDKLKLLRGDVRKVIEARLDRCLSQESAAREMGISSVTLPRIENGRTSVAEELAAQALAWATAPHERDGLQSARGDLPKPRYQRPLRTDPSPVLREIERAPERPAPPALLISDRCPMWGPAQISITESTCAWTRERATRCASCPGIAALAMEPRKETRS